MGPSKRPDMEGRSWSWSWGAGVLLLLSWALHACNAQQYAYTATISFASPRKTYTSADCTALTSSVMTYAASSSGNLMSCTVFSKSCSGNHMFCTVLVSPAVATSCPSLCLVSSLPACMHALVDQGSGLVVFTASGAGRGGG